MAEKLKKDTEADINEMSELPNSRLLQLLEEDDTLGESLSDLLVKIEPISPERD